MMTRYRRCFGTSVVRQMLFALTSFSFISCSSVLRAGEAGSDVRSRIASGQSVSASEVRAAVISVWTGEQTGGSNSAREALGLIECATPSAKDDLKLLSWLHERAAMILRSENKLSEAGKYYAKANEELEALETEAFVRRIENLINMADLSLQQRDKQKADRFLLQAQSYPYYLSHATGDNMRRLREAHERAIKGLIMTRAGDAEALRKIYLIPAMEGFRSEIDKAVKAAQ